MPATQEFKVGQRVKFKMSGKCARAEGMAGKMATATITGFEHARLGLISVMCDHRKVPGVPFANIGTAVSPKQLKLA